MIFVVTDILVFSSCESVWVMCSCIVFLWQYPRVLCSVFNVSVAVLPHILILWVSLFCILVLISVTVFRCSAFLSQCFCVCSCDNVTWFCVAVTVLSFCVFLVPFFPSSVAVHFEILHCYLYLCLYPLGHMFCMQPCQCSYTLVFISVLKFVILFFVFIMLFETQFLWLSFLWGNQSLQLCFHVWGALIKDFPRIMIRISEGHVAQEKALMSTPRNPGDYFLPKKLIINKYKCHGI